MEDREGGKVGGMEAEKITKKRREGIKRGRDLKEQGRRKKVKKGKLKEKDETSIQKKDIKKGIEKKLRENANNRDENEREKKRKKKGIEKQQKTTIREKHKKKEEEEEQEEEEYNEEEIG